jgi:L-iditol 2-dehydrogenase
MTAAYLLRPGALELREVPVPAPGPGELLVRVEAALTCGTDMKMYVRGHARLPVPAPFGHEFSGVVAAVGIGVTGFREGDAIACVPTAPCGVCARCAAGRENLCPDAVGRMVLGAYAEYVLVPGHVVARHVFHRPAHVHAAAAALLEPLACVVHGASRVERLLQNRTGTDVRIIGDGAIALLFARLAVMRGASVLVLGRHEARLAVAAAYGADTAIADGDAAAAVARHGGAELVVECVGRPDTWRLASAMTAAGGTVLLFGGCASGAEAVFDAAHLHYNEVDHVGAFHYTPRAVQEALELLCNGAVDAGPLINARVPLAQLQGALEAVLRRDAIKVELTP